MMAAMANQHQALLAQTEMMKQERDLLQLEHAQVQGRVLGTRLAGCLFRCVRLLERIGREPIWLTIGDQKPRGEGSGRTCATIDQIPCMSNPFR